MQRMAGTQIRVGRPLVHSVRDPDLLACVKGRSGTARSPHRPRQFARPRPHLRSQRRAPALRRRHRRASRRHPDRGRGELAPRIHRQRQPRTPHPAHLHPGLRRNSAGRPRAASPETAREFLGIIQKNARRMNRLTEDLLALASVESPDYKLARQPIRASALVARCHRISWAAWSSTPAWNWNAPAHPMPWFWPTPMP